MQSNLQDLPRAKTKEMEYGLKYLGVDSQLKRVAIPSVTGQGEYQGVNGTTIEFSLPTGRPGEFIDFSQTYLKFVLRNTVALGANDAGTLLRSMVPDPSAHCVINRLMVYYGSTLVEDILAYNVLAGLLKDLHDDEDSVSHRCSCTSAMSDGVGAVPLANIGHGQPIAAQVSTSVGIPLISGTVGILLDKLIPVWAMSFPIRIVIYLENAVTAFRWGTGAANIQSYSVLNPTMMCTYITTSADVARSTLPPDGVIRIPTMGWRNYVQAIPGGSSGYSVPISARFASIKTLYATMRASANLTVGNINTLTLRSKANLGSYQLRSGVNVIPNSIVECNDSAEPFMEILRTLHGMNATQFPLRFRRTYFLNDDANRINEYSFAPEHGQFVIALEMESLVRNSDKLLSGTDGRSADMFLDLVFNYRSVTSAVANDLFTYTNTMAAANNITAAQRIDVFVNYDLYLILDVVNGIVQTEI